MATLGVRSDYGVLFVDDEAKTCKYFRRLFEAEFPVLTAGDGEEALRVLADEHERLAVLLTDQRMPVRSGVSLLQEVRRSYPHIVRLLTTAYADLGDAVSAVNEGRVRAYITKPWDVPALRETLRAAVDEFLVYRHEQALLEGKRQLMMSVASYMAHEMRTPFSSIGAAASGIKRHLPPLLDGYRQAREEGLPVTPLRTGRLRALEDAVDNITRMVERANAVIEVLLVNAKGQGSVPLKLDSCSIHRCVDALLTEYPFAPGERQRLRIGPVPDFQFMGSEDLMVFVLINLLKNAFYAIAAAERGEVVIWGESCGGEHRVFVKDTGIGISEAQLPYAFDEFSSFRPSGSGTGLGLAFCKRVITGWGGSIECESEENVFTRFTLRLPAA
ncbi:MAG TPA: hybrid sensor histidine kinase/response regulator [Gammaproteobacteria bacterium]|nr:hybrid sensor histidine kinase/response regulator [Gammaproteobacteria bacterium]